MLRFSLLPVLLAATACASVSPDRTAQVTNPIVAAEQAFSARHRLVPLKQAFQEYAAADGVSVRPDGIVNVQTDLATWPDRDDKNSLGWWPRFAGAAQSGDLGFTTGPATYPGGTDGGYFTIWKKQADGSWKWMIDQGQGQNNDPPFSAAGVPVQLVPVSKVAPMDPAQAWKDLLAIDTETGAAAGRDLRTLAEKFAPEAYLMGLGNPPATDAVARSSILAGRPAKLAMKPEGGGVSSAGDFGWTYGYGNWTNTKGEARKGVYLRAWQRRPDGWKIVADNLSPFGRN